MAYEFDDLLASHYKKASNKEAFWGAAARGIGRMIPSAFKAVGGAVLGPGKSMASKVGFGAATAYGVGKAMNAGQNGPSINTPLGSFGSQKPQTGFGVTASLNEPFVEKAALAILGPKFASEMPGWHRAVNAASYGAFALPYLSQRVHDNPRLSAALNAAGLLGLGTTTAHNLAHGDKPAAWDLAGLGLMGAGMLHSSHQNT
jgi:hypothetical protein